MRHYPLLLLLWIAVEAHGLDGKDVSRRTRRRSNYRGGRGRSPYDPGSGFPTYGTERWNNIGGGSVPVGDSGAADNDNVFSSNNDWDRYSIGSGIWDNTGEDILSGTRPSGNESGTRNNWGDNFAVFGNSRWNNIFGGGAGPAQGGSVANETRQSGNGLRRGSNNWDDYFSAFGTGTRNNVGGATRDNGGGATRDNAGDATRNNAGGATRNTAGGATRNTAGGATRNTAGGATRNTAGGTTRNTAGEERRSTGTEKRDNSGTEESENAEDDESENSEDDESENAEDDESENAEDDESENAEDDESENAEDDESENEEDDESKNAEPEGSENAEPEGSENAETEENENGETEGSQNAAAEVNQNSAADSNENAETEASQDAEAAEARNDEPQNAEAERRGSYENNNNRDKYFTGFGSREQPTIAQGRGYAEGEDISIGSAQSGDAGGSGIRVNNGVASGYGEAKMNDN